jgi:hypothetical protein
VPNPATEHNIHFTRPADLAGASLRELLDGYQAHLSALVYARHGIGDPEPVGRLRTDALDVLACGQALVDQIHAGRWVTVAEALVYGAPLAHVAAAMGLEVDEVAAGLRSWADGQHRHGGLSAAARDEVCALLDEVAR